MKPIIYLLTLLVVSVSLYACAGKNPASTEDGMVKAVVEGFGKMDEQPRDCARANGFQPVAGAD
jgi:hypothetical protein